MDKFYTTKLMREQYLDKPVVILFNHFEIKGLLLDIDNNFFHLANATVKHNRRTMEGVVENIESNHGALSVSRSCLMIGLG